MMDGSCSMDVRTTGSVKNAILGGEGIFNTVVTGPGNIWLQTIPAFKMAQEMMRMMPMQK